MRQVCNNTIAGAIPCTGLRIKHATLGGYWFYNTTSNNLVVSQTSISYFNLESPSDLYRRNDSFYTLITGATYVRHGGLNLYGSAYMNTFQWAYQFNRTENGQYEIINDQDLTKRVSWNPRFTSYQYFSNVQHTAYFAHYNGINELLDFGAGELRCRILFSEWRLFRVWQQQHLVRWIAIDRQLRL
jgi:hypothetical protein